MKRTINLLSITIILIVASFTAIAQPSDPISNPAAFSVTNLMGDLPAPSLSHGLQEVYDAILGSTNYAVALGGGRGMTGNKNLVYADYLYNFNNNVGLVIGYDYLFSNDKSMPAAANVVKGGLNLKADLYPLRRVTGDTNSLFYNFKVTPFGGVLMATPINGTSNNGGLAEITLAGAEFQTPMFWGIHAHVGGFYENRVGQGDWSGNYLCVFGAFSKGF